LRALRHSRRTTHGAQPVGMPRALAAVVYERIAGLFALALSALLCGILFARSNLPIVGLACATILLLSLATCVVFRLASRKSALGPDRFAEQGRHALWTNHAWIFHLLSSSLSVALLSAEFYCAARAISVDISFFRALQVTPIILSSMVLPLSVAGWGVREAAAAAVFAALGLSAGSGMAVSVSFGLIGLVASLPGAIVWLAPADW